MADYQPLDKRELDRYIERDDPSVGEEGESTEPSLPEAIEWAKTWGNYWAQMTVKHFARTPHELELRLGIRRLVEAGEFEQQFGEIYASGTTEMIVRLQEAGGQKDRQIQALRRQLDAVGKELAEKDQRIEELNELIDHRVDEAKERLRLLGEARSQLAEKERELEHIRDLEKQRNKTIRNLTDKIQALDDKLDDFRLATNPDFIEAMSKIARGFSETEIDWSKVNKRTIRIEDPSNPLEIEAKIAMRQYRAQIDDPEPTDMDWIVEKLKVSSNFPGRLGIVEKKLEILADKNPSCFDDTGQPTLAPEPTPPEESRRASEAEVEKVGRRLRQELFGATDTKPFLSWDELDQHTRKEYCVVARHVIERGYRPKEE